ncbi:hypothetical protein PANT_15c00066 [Moesziomyces antarcticus T-34]|uniref:Uncharacterized protein n=1 Tax=Pseudozyma antarctica (strain T-34) TaxID=1151754 RepID=M9LXR7_PSEA3|nr:hypothetical protein PANT_15c00066 [Moesziomyces antarcticus T-34]
MKSAPKEGDVRRKELEKSSHSSFTLNLTSSSTHQVPGSNTKMLAKPNFIATSGSFALVLMFSVVSAHYPGASDLDINSNGYEALCGKDSDRKHPCFTHWWIGLDRAVVRFDNKALDVRKEVMVKDDYWTDFGMKDASEAFSLTYLDTNTAQLFYSNYNPVDGCYDIEVSISTGWML